MALVRNGTLGRSGGITAALTKQLRLLNLKPVKRITIKYDPFNESVKNVRDFSSLIHSKRAIKTNLLCVIKTDILCDRSESQIQFDLTDGKQFLFKCKNLTTLEVLEQVNKYITPLAPPEAVVTETKSVKKGKKK